MYLLFPVTLMILMPLFMSVKSRGIQQRVICQQQLQKIVSAVQSYADEHKVYPQKDQWMDLILTQSESMAEREFRCPVDSQGNVSYAMNRTLLDLKLEQVPANMVLLFETDHSHSSIGGPEDVVSRHHKEGQLGCNVGFADGSVRFVTENEIERLLWAITQP